MNTQEVIDQIKAQTKPSLDKWVLAQIERINNLNEYKKSDAYINIKSDANGIYRKRSIFEHTKAEKQFFHLQDLGYTKAETQNCVNGKVWIESHYKKEAQNKSKRIDVAVNKKLKDLDIKTIKQLYTNDGLDGFVEGSLIVTTTNGQQYNFSFETILAGGYNIQCLHIRVNYKLKEIKNPELSLELER